MDHRRPEGLVDRPLEALAADRPGEDRPEEGRPEGPRLEDPLEGPEEGLGRPRPDDRWDDPRDDRRAGPPERPLGPPRLAGRSRSRLRLRLTLLD